MRTRVSRRRGAARCAFRRGGPIPARQVANRRWRGSRPRRTLVVVPVGGDSNARAWRTAGWVVATLAAFAVLAAPAAAVTPAGSLDGSFGSGGKVSTTVGTGSSLARGAARQSDGKVVVVGERRSPSVDFAVVRYRTDGQLDPTFDGDGIAVTSFGIPSRARAVSINPSDGSITVVGESITQQPFGANEHDFAVARYLSTGAPDTSFSGDGKATYNVGASGDCSDTGSQGGGAFAVARWQSEKLLIAGCSGGGQGNGFTHATMIAINDNGRSEAGGPS